MIECEADLFVGVPLMIKTCGSSSNTAVFSQTFQRLREVICFYPPCILVKQVNHWRCFHLTQPVFIMVLAVGPFYERSINDFNAVTV